MKTSIIILTLNQLELTERCLDSIRKHTAESYELIVVDNGSTDGTVDYLLRQQDVIPVLNEHNLGFAKGCNQGAEVSSGEYLLFLNNDTVVTKHWLRPMLRLMETHDNLGLVGPVSNYAGGAQQIAVSYVKLSELDAFAEEHSRRHDGCFASTCRLVGFCLFAKKQIFAEIGGFDERFGIGTFEDDDLCLRFLNRGYTLAIALDSYVHHEGHATFYHTEGIEMSKCLEVNRQKARDKWGDDIYTLLQQKERTIPITISLCMIVKNEENTLPGCLDSVKEIADEIVIVDTGSADRTKEIAAAYTDKILDFKWIDDFAAARNFAFSHATREYILWLDADDVFLEEDRTKLLTLKRNFDRTVDSVTMHYHIAFDEQGSVTTHVRRNRLVKRANRFRWFGPVHEYLEVGGNIYNSDIAVTHHRRHGDSTRNLRIYEQRESRGEPFSPRDLVYYANELFDHHRFDKAIKYYRQFLDSHQGWVEDEIAACGKMADIYQHLGDPDKELHYTLKSFEYDAPRAEFCCRLGYHNLQRDRLTQAVFWYRLATQLEKPAESWGFFNEACWTWLPHLQLCLCYHRLGDNEEAYRHNEIARGYSPDHESVLHNQRFFEDILHFVPDKQTTG